MERIEIIIKKGNKEFSATIPVGKLSNVENADKLRVFAEALKQYSDEIKEATETLIIDNKGSEHFSFVKASESKKVDWKGLSEFYKIKQDDIDRYTTISQRKACLKFKNNEIF